MNTYLLPLTLLSGLLLVACGEDDTDSKVDDTEIEDTDTDTDADTDTDTDTDADADADIEIIRVGAIPGDTQWGYSVVANGEIRRAYVEIAGNAGGAAHDENHGLELVNRQEDPARDTWALDLPVVAVGEQVDGTNTAFVTADETGMTWMATAVIPDAGSDCVVWGANTSIFDSFGCRSITPD